MTKPLQPHPALTKYHTTEAARLAHLERLFDTTSQYYNQANRLFSFGTGDWYRRRALRRAGLLRGMRLLDVAVGTGLTAAAARRIMGSDADIIGLDSSERMLLEARRMMPIRLVRGQAEALPLPNSSVDFISVGYALRHVSNLSTAFAEFHRVLRPGGTLLVLEIGRADGRIAHALAAAYLGKMVPFVSSWLRPKSELAALMRYHWDTIEHCVSQEVILAQLRTSGFSEITCETDLRLFRAYRSRKPTRCCPSDGTCCSRPYPAAEAASPARSGAR